MADIFENQFFCKMFQATWTVITNRNAVQFWENPNKLLYLSPVIWTIVPFSRQKRHVFLFLKFSLDRTLYLSDIKRWEFLKLTFCSAIISRKNFTIFVIPDNKSTKCGYHNKSHEPIIHFVIKFYHCFLLVFTS